MLTLKLEKQQSYSRFELLMRAMFGWLYINLPHYFILGILQIWGSILTFVALITIVFTGRYPQSMFEFQVSLMRWTFRVQARGFHLADGYPPFSFESSSDTPQLEFDYPENLSRSSALLKLFFGWLYCGIPHGLILVFRHIASSILTFIAFWAILFTGEYPASFFEFNLGTIRWGMRVSAYLGFMTDEYPAFSGQENNNERLY